MADVVAKKMVLLMRWLQAQDTPRNAAGEQFYLNFRYFYLSLFACIWAGCVKYFYGLGLLQEMVTVTKSSHGLFPGFNLGAVFYL